MARKYAISSSESRHAQRSRDDVRRLIAVRAARLIIEGGLTDWSLAKRKAARQLGLAQTRALPDHEEITAALQAHQTLFQAEGHPAQLRAKRIEALDWMRRLERYSPVLVGGVAEGWATQFSETCLNLSADSVKEVEFALLAAGLPYRALGSSADSGAAELGFTGKCGPLRLVVNLGPTFRQSPKTSGALRLTAHELAALIESG